MPGRRLPEIDENTRSLVELGLTLNEARCYMGLLHTAPATAGELADFSGVPRPKVYGTLKSLEQQGFCFASGDPITTFRPVDPELALAEWIRRREHERRLADERDQRLGTELVARLPRPPEHAIEDMSEIMQLVGRPRRASEVLEELIDRAEQRVDICLAVPVFQPKARWNLSEVAALGRGVQVRMLFPSRELALEHRYGEILDAGGEVRVARSVPLRLAVRDNGAEAIVALPDPGDKRDSTCVVVRHSDLVAPIQLLFNREWRRAQPLPARAAEARKRA